MHHLVPGDVVEVLRRLPDNTFHGMLSDPPYGLSFMGKDWDKVVPGKEVWAECLRVLRPGAYVLVFGGTRTFHRLAVAMEDAGFEIRDVLSWMYGTGFPKSMDVSKAVDAHVTLGGSGSRQLRARDGRPVGEVGTNMHTHRSGKNDVNVTPAKGVTSSEGQQWSGYGTALKPAWEPVILARKPLDGTIAANVLKWGCGALAIDPCRIETSPDDAKAMARCNTPGSGRFKETAASDHSMGRPTKSEPLDTTKGRFPANVILDEEAGAHLDEVVGERPSTLTGRALPEVRCPHCQQWEAREEDLNAEFKCPHCGERYETWSAMWRDPLPQANPSKVRGERTVLAGRGGGGNVYADGGGPSRFFYSAKVSTKERNAGLEAFPVLSGGEATDREDGSDGLESPRAGAGRGGGNRNPHPTLKPIALTEYLARLLRPPGADTSLLVPFAGTASEMIGGLRAGWSRVVGIELDPQHVAIGNARILHHTKGTP